MNAATQKIYQAYAARFSQQQMWELSKDKTNGVYLVLDKTEAFNYDSITKQLYRKQGNNPKSVDALYINNKICFIEFKRGLKPNGSGNIKYLCNAIESAKASYLTHEKFLNENGGDCPTVVHNLFVLVINSGTSGNPSQAYASALADRANLTDVIRQKLTKQLVSLFGDGENFSSVDVWNDINFSDRLKNKS